MKYELYFCIVGNDDDIKLYEGSNKAQLERAIIQHGEEVDNNTDAYFLLMSWRGDYTFASVWEYWKHSELF